MTLNLHKKTLYFSLVLIFFLFTFLTAYQICGHALINVIYHQKSDLFHLLQARSTTPVTEYFSIADRIVKHVEWGGVIGMMALLIGAAIPSVEKRFLFWTIILGLSTTLYSQSAAVFNEYVINDDARQHIWWMRKFQDPTLFSYDLLATYAMSLQNIGMMGLYFLMSTLLDPVMLSKVLPIILMTLSAFYVHRISFKILHNPISGLLLAAAFLITPFYIQHTSGGHAHTFGFTLLLAFMYYFLAGDFRKTALVIIIQSLFFPIVMVISLATYLLWFITIQNRKIIFRFRSPALLPFFAALFICFFLLSLKFIVLRNPQIGRPFSIQQIKTMPELTKTGRWEVYPVKPVWKELLQNSQESLFIYETTQRLHFPTIVKKALLSKHLLTVILLIPLLFYFIRTKHIPFGDILSRLIFASIVLYQIASVSLLKIYAPDRYFFYSIPLSLFFLISIPILFFINSIHSSRNKAVCYILMGSILITQIGLIKNVGLTDVSKEKSVFEYLKTVPKNSFIAAPPTLADNIPILTKQKVYLNWELSVPLYDVYWQKIKERTTDFYNAYYADSPKTIIQFCKKNRIDYFVVKKSDFTQETLRRGQFYFEPFNTAIRQQLNHQATFSILNFPDEYKVFQTDQIFILDTRKIAKKYHVQ